MLSENDGANHYVDKYSVVYFRLVYCTWLESVSFELFAEKETRSLFHALMCTCNNNLILISELTEMIHSISLNTLYLL